MATALERLPREKHTLSRLATAYQELERVTKELEAIRLATIPKGSPVKDDVKAARDAARLALAHTGSALKQGPTLMPRPTAGAVRPRGRRQQTSVS